MEEVRVGNRLAPAVPLAMAEGGLRISMARKCSIRHESLER